MTAVSQHQILIAPSNPHLDETDGAAIHEVNPGLDPPSPRDHEVPAHDLHGRRIPKLARPRRPRVAPHDAHRRGLKRAHGGVEYRSKGWERGDCGGDDRYAQGPI